MPLEDYITETMSLLTNFPEADEIVVERGRPMRFAERNGYDEFYARFNQALPERLKAAEKN